MTKIVTFGINIIFYIPKDGYDRSRIIPSPITKKDRIELRRLGKLMKKGILLSEDVENMQKISNDSCDFLLVHHPMFINF